MKPKKQSAGASFLRAQAYRVRLNQLFIWLKRIPPKLVQGFRKIRFVDLVIIVIGIGLAILLRYSLIAFKSDDFSCCVQNWYSIIRARGKGAFRFGFANIHPLYLYCLYVVYKVFPQLADVSAIKLPSIIADFVCAFFVFRCVRLKFKQGPIPLISFFAVLFAPTVVLNGSFWGQSDSLYSAALVACIYFLLTKRNGLACLAYGLAFAFKLQAIFLAPFILALFLKKRISWWQLLLIPLVYLVTMLPSLMLGRSFVELLTVYFNQTSMFSMLTMNAPTMYTWLPDTLFTTLSTAGIIFAICIIFTYLLLIYKSREPITEPLIVQVALISAILVPFVLPKMHDRYFFRRISSRLLSRFISPNIFLFL